MKQLYSPYKAAHHLERIQALREGSLIFPTQVQVDLTNGCNHQCPYCFYRCARNEELNAKFDLADTIPTERMLSLIDELVEAKVPAIQYTGGGEPLTHPDFYKILTHTIRKELEWSLVTNGALLQKCFVDFYKTATWIRISVDAATPSTYARSQGCPAEEFEKVCANIQALVKNCPQTEIGLSFVVNPINYKEIVAFKKLAEDLGVQNIRYSVSYTPRGIEIFKEHWEEVLSLSREVRTSGNGKLQVFDMIESHLEDLDMKRKGYSDCGYQHFTAVVGANLELYPCCTLKYSSCVSLGNLKEASFKDVWFGKARTDWLGSSYMKRVCNNKPCWMDKKNEFISYLLSNNPPHINYI